MTSPNGGTRQQSARPPGRVVPFGKYLLLDRVAVGGMAEVYLAKSFGVEGFEKVVAIKRILPTMAEDDDFIAMFIDEAKIAGQLTHANIAPIFELGKIGESHYIAMEYVWGKDLLQIMNRFRRMRKRMPPPMAAWAASRMCEALGYAHQKTDRNGESLHIIHRDVSPQNVLCSYEGEIKLIDFGIAKAASRTTKTQAGVLKGKFGYMSPEQVRGLAIDSRSDLFAVGTCMYEMLTCERLFMGESDFSTLEKVRNASVPPVGEVVADIAPELNHIVMKALQREAGDRWQTAAELQDALQGFLATQAPQFTTSRMSSWLKNAFATEMAREKERLDSFTHVGRPSTGAGSWPAPRPSAAPSAGTVPKPGTAPRVDDDLTMQEPSPLVGKALAGKDNGGGAFSEPATERTIPTYDEGAPTQIYFSSGELGHATITDHLEPTGPGADAATHVLPPGAKPGVVAPGAAGHPAFAPTHAFNSTHALYPIPGGGQSPGAHGPAFGPTGGPSGAGAMGAPSTGPVPPAGPFVQPGLGDAPPSAGLANARGSTAPSPVAPAFQPNASLEPAGGTAKWAGIFGLLAVVMVSLGVGIAFLLFRDAPTGTVEIRTNPSVGATVKIDNVPRGRAPLRIQHVSAGEHLIEVEADGYESVVRRVPVAGGSFSTFAISLVETEARADATPVATAPVRSSPTAPDRAGESPPSTAPDDAALEQRQKTQKAREAARAALRQRIAERRAAEREEREEERRRVEERRRAQATMRQQQSSMRSSSQMRPTTMEAAAPSQGVLRINSIPRSEVTVDGQSRGHTPIMSLRVGPGVHRIELRTGDGRTHSRVVTIEAGETTSVGHQF